MARAIPLHIATDAVDDERGRVRYGRGILDADARRVEGIERVVPAAVPLFDCELCVYRIGPILDHEVNQIQLARVIIVDAQNPDRVLVRYARPIYIRLVKPAQDRWRDAGNLPRRHDLSRRRCSSDGAPAWCLPHSTPRGEVRGRRNSSNVCVQYRGERVANRADYHLVRLRVPV